MEGDPAGPLDGEAVGTSSRSSVGFVSPGGEPLWHVPNDPAYSFQCEEGQKIGLNKRLPGIAQSDVSPSVGFESSISRTKRQATRWVVRGSRLFNEICGHTRAGRNSAACLGRDPKRLPSSFYNTDGRAGARPYRFSGKRARKISFHPGTTPSALIILSKTSGSTPRYAA